MSALKLIYTRSRPPPDDATGLGGCKSRYNREARVRIDTERSMEDATISSVTCFCPLSVIMTLVEAGEIVLVGISNCNLNLQT